MNHAAERVIPAHVAQSDRTVGGGAQRQIVEIVHGVDSGRQGNLFEIGQAAGAPGPLARRRQRRQQHRSQNGDDRDHNQEFYEGENRPMLHFFPSFR